jgi:hypothetical protein
MSNKNLVTFVDQIGRVIVGEVVTDTKESVKLKNPAIIHIGQNPQTGQIQVQTIPYFFREFVSTDSQKEGTTWKFLKSSIVEGDVNLDERLVTQYERLFTAPLASPAPVAGKSQGAAEVVKLFDDEDDKK